MWIRSQNDYILANVNSLRICKCRICKCDIDGCIYYSIHGHYDRYEQELGIYSTKEKALKVLDEIQNAIENNGYYNIDNFCLNTYALKRGTQVYQMPADDEVDV